MPNQEAIDLLMKNVIRLKLEIKIALFLGEIPEGINVHEARKQLGRELKVLWGYVGCHPFQYNGSTYRIDYDMLYALQLWQLL